MKKILVISGLMMAAIVALTGCQKEQNFIDRSFTVTASTDNGTKTTNDGMSTLWAEGDKISVFYKTDDSYSAGIAMTLSDGAGTKGGVFAAAAGSAEIPSGTKDWYAIYPSGAKSPASVDKDGGYTYVGNRNGLTQQGYDDTSILSGNSCPMYGVAKDVSGNPAFTMKQLASVIEFNIVNKTDAPVKINKVTLDESESDEAIVGSFYVDFTGEKPEFVKSGDDYVSTKAFTSVANATELPVDATAKVYMPLVPFAHDPMKSFFVLIDGEVNGSAFTSTVALHPTADKCLFEAGKIKRVNVPLEELEEATPPDFTTIAELNTLAADLTTATTFVGKLTDATVSFVPDAKNAFVKDATGSILFYKNDHGLKQGQTYSGNITVSATVYKGLAEVTTWDAAFTGEEAVVAPEEVTLAAIAGDYNKYQSSYVKVANLEVVSVDNKNINVKDGDVNYIVFYNPGNAPIQEGDVITAIGTVTKYNTTEELKVWKSDDIQKAGGDDPGPGPEPEGTLVEVVMKDFVANNRYTVSSGNTATCYPNLDLSPAVRLSTTGAANCGSFWGDSTIDWRLYQARNGNAIITVAEGCTLQLVQFTFTTSNNGVLKYGDEVVETGKGIECSGNQVEFTVGNSGDKTNGQIKITAVKVIYTGSGTLPAIVEPEPGETETKITMANTNSVYVGETVALGATANVEATITYESEDTSIATVDASGVVTGVAAGSVKVYARVAANEGHWTAAEKYCTVTVSEPPVATGHYYVKTETLSEGKYLLVSAYNSVNYVCSGLISNKSLTLVDASDLISSGKIASDTGIDTYAINISAAESAEGYTFTNSAGKYISVSSGNLSSSDDVQVWTITQHTDGSWIFAHSTTETRALFIGNNGSLCKNYSLSNFGGSGYASTYLTLFRYE